MNESTWEHLKLAFWPALAVALIQRRLYGRPQGWLGATVLRVLVPPILIVLLFYGYVALIGRHYLLLDIAIFVVAVVIGEVLGDVVMWMRIGLGIRASALAVLVLSVLAFATLSFRPPAFFLFDEPAQGAAKNPYALVELLRHATLDNTRLITRGSGFGQKGRRRMRLIGARR
jgi:hypothetical protein